MQAQVEKYIFSYFIWGTEASFLKMHSSKGHSLNEMLVLWISPSPLPPCVTRVCFTGGHCLIWWRSWSLSLNWFWWLPAILRFLAPYWSSCSPISFLIHIPSSESFSTDWGCRCCCQCPKKPFTSYGKGVQSPEKVSTLCHHVLVEKSLLQSWSSHANFLSPNLNSINLLQLMILCTEQWPVFWAVEGQQKKQLSVVYLFLVHGNCEHTQRL